MRDELLSPEVDEQEVEVEFNENGLRPASLEEFVGQPSSKTT